MSLPRWFNKDWRSEQNRQSRKQEEKEAKAVGGKRVAGSGSSWRSPGDIRTNQYLVECKFSYKRSFTITRRMLEQHISRALSLGRDPCFIIEFRGETPLKVMITIHEP